MRTKVDCGRLVFFLILKLGHVVPIDIYLGFSKIRLVIKSIKISLNVIFWISPHLDKIPPYLSSLVKNYETILIQSTDFGFLLF